MSVTEKIEQWEIDRLIPYARNPRKNDHAVDRIASAIREFGFKVPIIAKSNGDVVDGHLRLKAAQKLGMDTVPVVIADDLTDAQVKAFRISVNRMAEFAEWDDELLRIEFAELGDLEFDLSLTGFGLDEIDALSFDDDSERELDAEKYTSKIETPIYEMKGKKPAIGELYNTDKTGDLTKRIMAADLPDDVRGFLMAAATRHTVFNYENIAEFYAHQDREVQELMEQSALVIVDYSKAIENGYVKLTKALMQLSGESDNVAE